VSHLKIKNGHKICTPGCCTFTFKLSANSLEPDLFS
jgi:hypothetical protein